MTCFSLQSGSNSATIGCGGRPSLNHARDCPGKVSAAMFPRKAAHALKELPPDPINRRVLASAWRSEMAEPGRSRCTFGSLRILASSSSVPSETTRAGSGRPNSLRTASKVFTNHHKGVRTGPVGLYDVVAGDGGKSRAHLMFTPIVNPSAVSATLSQRPLVAESKADLRYRWSADKSAKWFLSPENCTKVLPAPRPSSDPSWTRCAFARTRHFWNPVSSSSLALK